MTVLCCDLGGTRMKVGIVEKGRLRARADEPADSKTGLASVLPALETTWMRLLGELTLYVSDCAGISMAFPSLVDITTGRVLAEYGKYADAVNFDFRVWARKQLGLPLAIENDARMALVGEWKYGAGRGSDSVAIITLGTGLGTAALINGQLLRGQHGQAGVLGGHVTVRYGGRECSCGNQGCAEAEASTAFLEKIASSLPEWNSSPLRKLPLNYAEVFKHAEAGDPCALKLREHSLQVWGALAVNLIHAYDPEALILAGGIMGARDVILPAISDYVRRRAHTPWGKVRVVSGELGDTAALLAGEWLLTEQHPKTLK